MQICDYFVIYFFICLFVYIYLFIYLLAIYYYVDMNPMTLQVSPACISDITFTRSDRASISLSDTLVPPAKQPRIAQLSDVEMEFFLQRSTRQL